VSLLDGVHQRGAILLGFVWCIYVAVVCENELNVCMDGCRSNY
jgi:hypothetical protein